MEDLFAMDEGNMNNNNDLRCIEKPVFCNEPQYEAKPGFIPANIPDIRSTEDPVLINDARVLSNILARQDLKSNSSTRQPTYFENGVQPDIKSHMRKIVSDWMLEVCEEQRCQPEVFHLAINYMDRFLSEVRIAKSQFQLLSCVCLFLASKFKETCPLPAENLVIYTDSSVTIQEITQWELMVLNVLHWDLSSVTPYSILDNILRSSQNSKLHNLDISTVRRHSETFVALAATEPDFMGYSSAVIAGASLGAAVRGLKAGSYGKSTLENSNQLHTLLEHLHSATNANKGAIKECMDQIEISICMSMSGMSFQPATLTEKPNSRQFVQDNHQLSHSGLTHPSNSSTAQVMVVPNGNTSSLSSHSSTTSKTAYLSSASTTPTDLMDVVSSAAYVGAY